MAFLNPEKRDILHKHKRIIDVLRTNGSVDKNTIVNESKLSWSTVNTYLDELITKKVIVNEHNLYYLNGEYAYIAGISIGVTEIKLSIIDLKFEKTSNTKKKIIELNKYFKENEIKVKEYQEYICMDTPANYIHCCDMCSNIVRGILDVFSDDDRLLSIGLSVPGIIDKNTHIIEFSPNIPWLNKTDTELLVNYDLINKFRNNGGLFEVYHDMDAVTVYEMETFLKNKNIRVKNSQDILCLFMSYGIGSTLIKNNTLSLFSSSEHGHIMTSVMDNSSNKNNVRLCSCGKDCLENQIRHKVFEVDSIENFHNKMTNEKLEDLSYEKYNLLRNYLAFLFNHIVNTMRVDTIIISGRILNNIESLKYDMTRICMENTISVLSKKCVILNGSSDLDIAALGAAMISYHNFTSNEEAKDLIISW